MITFTVINVYDKEINLGDDCRRLNPNTINHILKSTLQSNQANTGSNLIQ